MAEPLALPEDRAALSEVEAKHLLRQAGLPVPDGVLIRDPARVAEQLEGLRPPFALKVVSEKILHKSDAGGVALNLDSADAVSAAIAAMAARPAIAAARPDGFLVEEMAPPGTEAVIGAVLDPQFGPLVMVGLGGIFVEVMQDVAFGICPISRADAAAMIRSLKAAPVFAGARGRPPLATERLIDILLAIGGPDGLMRRAGGRIRELDLNPVILTQETATIADARILLSRPVTADRQDLPAPDFDKLLRPETVAVVGASTRTTAIANNFIQRMKEFGYRGRMVPIHPTATEIEGLPCCPSLAEVPGTVDYAYIAVAADRIPALFDGCEEGKLRFAQVISSGFREVEEGRALEKELVTRARAVGARVIGPNCLGMYSPGGGVTFPKDASREAGGVAVVTQSGGMGTDIITRGQLQGLKFRALVTAGNSADLGPVDFLEYFLGDPETKVIGLYIEDVKDGARLYRLMRETATRKPVVILRGGRSAQGQAAAASHTGALAGSGEAWKALARQTPVAYADTVDDFINALITFQALTPRPDRPTRRLVLFGNGGGTSVLAADTLAELGFDVSPFSQETQALFDPLELPPGTSIANPIDTPVATMQREEGRIAEKILEIVFGAERPDGMIIHLNLASFVGRGDSDPVDTFMGAVLKFVAREASRTHFALVLRSDGSPALDQRKRALTLRAMEAGIPVYDEIPPAATAFAALHQIEAQWAFKEKIDGH